MGLPAGVSANAGLAGNIASRSGSATLAPTPLSTARRGTCFLKMNMAVVSLSARAQRGLRRAAHSKLIRLDHRFHDGGKFVVFRCRLADDLADGRHVVVFARAAHGVGQKILDEGLHELVGVAQER